MTKTTTVLYTKHMRWTRFNSLFNNASLVTSLYLAFFFMVVALAQLVAFEKYPDVIAGFGLHTSQPMNFVIADVIVLLEILALPYLLRMNVSTLLLIISRTSGVLVLVFWLLIGIWQSMTAEMFQNAGLFGAKVPTPSGWWLVYYMIALLVLYGYVAGLAKTERKSPTSRKKATSHTRHVNVRHIADE